ncbi:MAG TPA: sugar-binding transcriptional regulator [Candidatus Atribacteria bacterium]|nr:sugar-binding transcriptional regulator [Candidatus Atribacteria bacterium]
MDNKELKQERLMIQAAKLFYQDGLSMVEASELLGISRQKFSQLVKMAKETGVVQIKILDPEENRILELEEALKNRFALKKVRVVEVFSDQGELVRKSVGEAGFRLLSELVKPGDKIGIAYGRTLYQLVLFARPINCPNLGVVQLMGGLSRISADVVATEIPRRLANILDAQVYYLMAPAFTKDQTTRDAILQDENVQATLREKIDIALVGIGNLSPEATLIRTETITQAEHQELLDKKAVGDVCGIYFDVQGRIIDFPGNQRRIARSLEDLKKIPFVVGIAGGLDKTQAILGALRGGLVNALVVDKITAERLLKLEEEE